MKPSDRITERYKEGIMSGQQFTNVGMREAVIGLACAISEVKVLLDEMDERLKALEDKETTI